MASLIISKQNWNFDACPGADQISLRLRQEIFEYRKVRATMIGF